MQEKKTEFNNLTSLEITCTLYSPITNVAFDSYVEGVGPDENDEETD